MKQLIMLKKDFNFLYPPPIVGFITGNMQIITYFSGVGRDWLQLQEINFNSTMLLRKGSLEELRYL